MEEVETYPEVEEVGNLYTYVEPILESELKPGPVEASMYRRFLKYVELGTQLRETGQKMPGLFYGETKDLKTIVLPRRLIQRHFSQNETSQSKDELGGGKKTRRRRRKTKRRKHKKRYSRKYRKN